MEHREKYLGKFLEILIEEKIEKKVIDGKEVEKEVFYGYSDNYLKVKCLASNDKNFEVNQLLRLKISALEGDILIGEKGE